ncbi:RNA exonuclease ngl2 [Entomophthora muscae]|uniref:RNA exonuclease ngl2 n=1 Tax=Entomophthora muscae TaxID=34485 RepID=A0ACC2U677_9FUNG|nr:RNA exonuclease ngl2 [Entomophthora muscae]
MGYGTIYYANEKKKHGCCIAYKSKKFRVGTTRVFEFDDETDYPRSATTGNVGVLAELRSLIDGRGVIIANCHLYWDPCGQYERLRQTLILSNEIKKLKAELKLTAILCGDFNSQPLDLVYYALTHSFSKDNISDIIKDMANSMDLKEASIKKEIEEVQDICNTIDEGLAKIKAVKVDIPLGPVDLDELDGIENANKRKLSEVSELADDLREAKLKKVKLSAQLNGFDSLVPPQKLYDAILEHSRLISCYSSYAQLDSNYACDNWESDEPKFTNYTDKFKSTLDYIFIPESSDSQSDNFFLARLLSLPPTKTLGTGLPDVNNPSDHFPLMAALKWSTSKVYES